MSRSVVLWQLAVASARLQRTCRLRQLERRLRLRARCGRLEPRGLLLLAVVRSVLRERAAELPDV